MDAAHIYAEVSRHYSHAARNNSDSYGETIARAFGYSVEQLAGVAEGSNLGLSCGNPLAIASLQEGETVIDLGSGAGFDVFLAADVVGPSGRVIGVDMNMDMLARATKIKQETQKANVEFLESKITDIPKLDSGIADCIISNCVVNLVPELEKHLVFKEIHRLLKPGGRVAISDILAKKPLPEKLRSDIALYVDCVSGASMVAEYESYLRDSGFEDILITDTRADLNVYKDAADNEVKVVSGQGIVPNEGGCCNRKADMRRNNGKLGSSESCYLSNAVDMHDDLNEWVGSFRVYATKVV